MERQFRINRPAVIEEAKERRKEQKLTQQQLAELAGVSTPTISHFENGKKDIQVSTVNRILKVLGMLDERTLVLRDADPEPAGLDIRFEARDGDKTVKCLIAYEALADHFGADRKNRFDIFDANRATIEREARRKYLIGALEADGSVLIKSEDLYR
jgi:transcriptional regulator with XRE-family HTH domain